MSESEPEHLHLHVHFVGLERLFEAFKGMNQKLDQVIARQRAEREQIMAGFKDTKDLIDQVNTATNDLAGRVDAIVNQLKDEPTPEEVAAANDQLTAISAHLKAIAADPANPVPPAPTA